MSGQDRRRGGHAFQRAAARHDLPAGWLGYVATGEARGHTAIVLTDHIDPRDVATALRHVVDAHSGYGGIVACYSPACTQAEVWCLEPTAAEDTAAGVA